MFLYTRAMIDKILSELGHFLKIFGIALDFLYIGYLITAIFIPVGIPIINGILVTLALGQFIFNAVYDIEDDKKEKLNKRTVRRIVQYTKLTVNAISLGIVIYTTAISLSSNNPAVWILPIITAVLWMIKVLFEILLKYFDSRAEFILDAFKLDIAPVYKAHNFINTLKGQLSEDDGSIAPDHESILNELKTSYVEQQSKNKEIKKEKRAKIKIQQRIAFINRKAKIKAQKIQAKEAKKAIKQTTNQNT